MTRIFLHGLTLLVAFIVAPFPSGNERSTPLSKSHGRVVVNNSANGLMVSSDAFTVQFMPTGIAFNPNNGGPQWNWSLSGFSPQMPSQISDDKIIYDRGDYREEYLLDDSFIEQQFI